MLRQRFHRVALATRRLTGAPPPWKASWGIAFVSAVIIAGALIPVAAGGTRPPTYTFTGDTAVCAGTQTTTFDVVLKNTSPNPQNLGSADLYAPSDISVTSASMSGSTTGTLAWSTFAGAVTPDLNDPTTMGRSLISLRALTVPVNSSVTVHVTASLTGPGSGTYWYSVVKQSNQFNPGSFDTSNGFSIQGSNPKLTVAPCQYYFSQQPTNAQTGTAQTVKVQLRSGTTAVSVPGTLRLDATQDGVTGSVATNFNGLTSTGGQDASNTWTFSVTGINSGNNFHLVAGGGTTSEADSNSFNISNCLPDASGNCTSGTIFDPNGQMAGQFTGSGIMGDGINLTYGGLPPTGAGICTNGGWGWSPMTFTSPPGNFDGISLESFSYPGPTGFVKMTIYYRNDFYVQTTASQTNNIAICAGARHTNSPNGPGLAPFMGRNGISAVYDSTTNDYWAVLARVPNCNKSPDVNNDGILDPVLCGWGTVTLSDGLSYRSATVLVPYDWDIKFGS
jgi:hypothetical protein